MLFIYLLDNLFISLHILFFWQFRSSIESYWLPAGESCCSSVITSASKIEWNKVRRDIHGPWRMKNDSLMFPPNTVSGCPVLFVGGARGSGHLALQSERFQILTEIPSCFVNWRSVTWNTAPADVMPNASLAKAGVVLVNVAPFLPPPQTRP